ncbi:MAG: LysR family transcriptional regulator [Clostridiaceae bacterium]|nr:LysR family transcriptional regulator [Clostridiaceae bacterium]
MLYEKLNYVLTIAEEQNLTRAAKRLFISQPTLTLYLNRLEAELGVRLFDRSKTPITLTEAGSYYIEEMKKISASEQLLRNDIKFIANPSQTLIVGIGQVRGHHWLPMMLPTFCSIYPHVNVQVVQSTEQYLNEALHTRRLDVAFGVLPSSVSDLKVVDLMYEKMFLVSHRKFGLVPYSERSQYSADRPYVIPYSKLNGLPFIIPQVNNGLYDSYEKIVLENQIHPSRTISVNNLKTGLELALKGLGVQLLSGSILQCEPNQADVGEYLDFCVLEDMPQTRKCVAAYDGSSIKLNLIEDLIRIVQNEVLPDCKHISLIE